MNNNNKNTKQIKSMHIQICMFAIQKKMFRLKYIYKQIQTWHKKYLHSLTTIQAEVAVNIFVFCLSVLLTHY